MLQARGAKLSHFRKLLAFDGATVRDNTRHFLFIGGQRMRIIRDYR